MGILPVLRIGKNGRIDFYGIHQHRRDGRSVFLVPTVVAVQGIGDGGIFVLRSHQGAPIPGFGHPNGTPVDTGLKGIGQSTADGGLGIQLVGDLVGHPFINEIEILASFRIKFGKSGKGIGILSVAVRAKLQTFHKLDGIPLRFGFCKLGAQLILRQIQQAVFFQRAVQLDGGLGIILRLDLVSVKARPHLFAAEGHLGGQSVGNLVVGRTAINPQVLAGGALRLHAVDYVLQIFTVDGHAVVIHGLLKPVDIFPSQVVVPGQPCYLHPPVERIVHDQRGVTAVGVLLVGRKLLHRFFRIIQGIALQVPVKGQVQVGPFIAAGVRVLPGLVQRMACDTGKGIGEREIIGHPVRNCLVGRDRGIALDTAIVRIGRGGLHTADFLQIIGVGHTGIREQREILQPERPLHRSACRALVIRSG